MLTREEILSKWSRLQIEPVIVDGDEVYVRELTASERDAYESSIMNMRIGADGTQSFTTNTRDMRARLVAMSLCDEEGTRVFGDDDVAAVGALSAAAIDKVFGIAKRLSAVTDDDLEELVGNSEKTLHAVSN